MRRRLACIHLVVDRACVECPGVESVEYDMFDDAPNELFGRLERQMLSILLQDVHVCLL